MFLRRVLFYIYIYVCVCVSSERKMKRKWDLLLENKTERNRQLPNLMLKVREAFEGTICEAIRLISPLMSLWTSVRSTNQWLSETYILKMISKKRESSLGERNIYIYFLTTPI